MFREGAAGRGLLRYACVVCVVRVVRVVPLGVMGEGKALATKH